MKIILALHSSGETNSPANPVMLRSYIHEGKLAESLRCFGDEVLIIGTSDRKTWAQTLPSLAYTIDSCHLVITTDNGILALALALGKETIALMGPTDNKSIIHQFDKYVDNNYTIIRGEYDKAECSSPCNFRSERGFEVNGKCANGYADCMDSIPVDLILGEVMRYNLINFH